MQTPLVASLPVYIHSSRHAEQVIFRLSILRHEWIHLDGPRVDSSGKISNLTKPIAEQYLLGVGGAHSMVAHAHDLFVLPVGQFAKPTWKGIEGDVVNVIQVGDLQFFRRAHI